MQYASDFGNDLLHADGSVEYGSLPFIILMIEHSMYGKRTLMTVPAGFGKNPLVTMWLYVIQKDQERKHIAWGFPENGDNGLR